MTERYLRRKEEGFETAEYDDYVRDLERGFNRMKHLISSIAELENTNAVNYQNLRRVIREAIAWESSNA